VLGVSLAILRAPSKASPAQAIFPKPESASRTRNRDRRDPWAAPEPPMGVKEGQEAAGGRLLVRRLSKILPAPRGAALGVRSRRLEHTGEPGQALGLDAASFEPGSSMAVRRCRACQALITSTGDSVLVEGQEAFEAALRARLCQIRRSRPASRGGQLTMEGGLARSQTDDPRREADGADFVVAQPPHEAGRPRRKAGSPDPGWPTHDVRRADHDPGWLEPSACSGSQGLNGPAGPSVYQNASKRSLQDLPP
jgi:hypothetical protein